MALIKCGGNALDEFRTLIAPGYLYAFGISNDPVHAAPYTLSSASAQGCLVNTTGYSTLSWNQSVQISVMGLNSDGTLTELTPSSSAVDVSAHDFVFFSSKSTGSYTQTISLS